MKIKLTRVSHWRKDSPPPTEHEVETLEELKALHPDIAKYGLILDFEYRDWVEARIYDDYNE